MVNKIHVMTLFVDLEKCRIAQERSLSDEFSGLICTIGLLMRDFINWFESLCRTHPECTWQFFIGWVLE